MDNKKKIDVGKHGDQISAYDIEDRKFAKGDKIVFLKNDNLLRVKNGTFGKISKIDGKGNVNVVIGKGAEAREVFFNLNVNSQKGPVET